jgi:NCS2 family nucleobase:cation symporter-2
MYAGAIAVPLIIGRALKLSPEQVALLILGGPVLLRRRDADPVLRADASGSGIRMPVMMGVTFAAVGRWWRLPTPRPAPNGARRSSARSSRPAVIGICIAPIASRMLRFFPPVVTGTIIAIIGIS